MIKPALQGAVAGHGPVIDSIDCTECGRCIDVCDRDVFGLALGGTNQSDGNPDPAAIVCRGSPRLY